METKTHSIGICAMDKKVKSKHMEKILSNLKSFDEFNIIIIPEEIFTKEDIEKWPIVESLIVFFSTGFPFGKVNEYIKLRKPFLINDFEKQKIFWDRREIRKLLKANDIPTPISIVVDRREIIDNDCEHQNNTIELNNSFEIENMIKEYNKEYKTKEFENINQQNNFDLTLEKNISNNSIKELPSIPDLSNLEDIPAEENSFDLAEDEEITDENTNSQRYETINKELLEFDEYLEYKGKKIMKPFLEKPANGDDHNIYIYYPLSHGGGQKRLFRKTKNLSSLFYPDKNKIRRDNKSYIYEEFVQSDGFDIKVYTVGEDYAHAEARKSPTLDGVVQRTLEGKEVRYPVNLTQEEKEIARKIVKIFGQNVCGFDILRGRTKSYVCDVNGWSFVKGNKKYYEDCAIQIRKIILTNLDPELYNKKLFSLYKTIKLPNDTRKSGEELRSVVGVIRHSDRSPKQKLKFIVTLPAILKLFNIFSNNNYKNIDDEKQKLKDLKLKKPKELMTVLNIVNATLAKNGVNGDKFLGDVDDLYMKLFQVKLILEKNTNFEGMTRKIQLRPLKYNKIFLMNNKIDYNITEALMIVKWGGHITHSGIEQAKQLGNKFRVQLYPINKTNGEDLLRLHSTLKHDLKCYSSEEGRCLKSSAAFLQGLLQLDGSLIPIITSIVRKGDTINKLLDVTCVNDMRKNVKNSLIEICNYNGNFKEKYFNNDDKSDNKKPINDLISDIKNYYEKMQKVYELLRLVMQHLKSKLNIQEINKECSTYLVRYASSIHPRKNSYNFVEMKSNILKAFKDVKKKYKKKQRTNSAGNYISNKTIEYLENEKKKLEKPKLSFHKKKKKKINVQKIDCEEEKIILIYKRYNKLYQEFFDLESKQFKISKVIEIYDNIKYDIIHNKSIISSDGYELYNTIHKLACFLMPMEYGITDEQKISISQDFINPLLTKIEQDLLWIDKSEKLNKNSRISKILSDEEIQNEDIKFKQIRTRFYFTTQSHMYPLLNALLYGGNSILVDENNEGKKVWNIFDMDYCSYIVFRLYENFNVSENDENRFRIEILISSGANKDPKLSDNNHLLTINPWIVLNDHLNLEEIKKYFGSVLKSE